MKSYKNLFEKLISYENIHEAIMRSAKRKRRREDVQKVLNNIDFYIKRVQELLVNKTFKARVHTIKIVQDGPARKKRMIIQPDYLYEQIVHHALIQILKPIFMKGMYDFSCGSIPDRGGHYAKRYIEKFIKNNPKDTKYVLKLDVKKYFQSINPEILKNKFQKIIKDDDIMWVISSILDSDKAIVDGSEIEMGLPIGFYTSQWFANWFLQDFDHFVKEKLKAKCYVRYIDDIVVFGRNKKELHKSRLLIKDYLERLELRVKENWQVFKFDYIAKDGKRKGRPLDFVGFKFYKDKTTLRWSILLKATQKAKRIHKKQNTTWFDACQMVSYFGWFKKTRTFQIYKKHIAPFASIKSCKRVISGHQNKINKGGQNGNLEKR